MAGPSRTCCVSEYCTGVPHNQHPWHFHSLRLIPMPFTKSAEEPNKGVHLSLGYAPPRYPVGKLYKETLGYPDDSIDLWSTLWNQRYRKVDS